jgi:hypothetical protein
MGNGITKSINQEHGMADANTEQKTNALRDFANALKTNWSTNTDGLYAGEDKPALIADKFDALIITVGTSVSADQLPKRDLPSLQKFIKSQPRLDADYEKLTPQLRAKFNDYMPTALDVRVTKDLATQVAGTAAVDAVAKPINEAGAESVNEVQAINVDQLVAASVKQHLGIRGADVKVAAWQEAMNAYKAEKNGLPIKVDGAWGRETQTLFDSLGGDAQAALIEMKEKGITLHPEHFEVNAPGSTPASVPQNQTSGPSPS